MVLTDAAPKRGLGFFGLGFYKYIAPTALGKNRTATQNVGFRPNASAP
jgi:hypothetical protein